MDWQSGLALGNWLCSVAFGPWRVSSFVFTLIEELFGWGPSMSRMLPVFRSLPFSLYR